MSKKNEENTKFILPAAKGQSIMIIVKHTHVTFNYLNKATIIIKRQRKKERGRNWPGQALVILFMSSQRG